ncbi:hypothetical protein Lalb_Chr05g0214051 [Lupinus albus]|uniref:Uncharacterized protein n=1 Tax=Lupinus albus TaxID=3870 RepID=A0A6A4QG50_LUPAL|nr:hypothetical protein Lalb_Chr05g0214051 [Lupinus albus]
MMSIIERYRTQFLCVHSDHLSLAHPSLLILFIINFKQSVVFLKLVIKISSKTLYFPCANFFHLWRYWQFP